MYGVGDYIFAKYRVTWKFMASNVKAVVLSQTKTSFGVKELISTKTTALFAVGNKREAHYLCAILNSDVVDSFIRSFSAAGRGFGAPSVMENLSIPEFDSEIQVHSRLAELSIDAHTLVARGQDISDQEIQINEGVRRLWNIKS
jgi:adenine-specific DNA-methyltransferase